MVCFKLSGLFTLTLLVVASSNAVSFFYSGAD